jgi:3-oxoacyl-[acyl-carrier-protein] synthase II
MALEGALQALRAGEVDLALAGGADGLCQVTFAGFNSLRAVADGACLPFRAGRNGVCMGEGAGVLVLETMERARSRGVPILAEFAGAGSSCDAVHMTAPDEEGRGAAAAVRVALKDAGLEPSGIDFVNAHGTGTPHNYRAEFAALKAVFGTRVSEIPLAASKPIFGHLLGASGALEAVATVLCLLHGEVHAAPGPAEVDPALPVRLVVGEPLRIRLPAAALSLSLGFGGTNAALVFRSGAR